jgi:hypothetical protein
MSKRNHLEHFFQSTNLELFQFAFALVPDESKARELLIDSISAILRDEAEIVEEFVQSEDDSGGEELKKVLYARVFMIASRRGSHRSINRIGSEEWAPFYALDLVDRAVLFLKHSTLFSYDDMEEILNLFKHEIMTHAITARNEVLTTAGLHTL